MTTPPPTHRERAVPCGLCGAQRNANGTITPRTTTWRLSGLCLRHEEQENARAQQKNLETACS